MKDDASALPARTPFGACPGMEDFFGSMGLPEPAGDVTIEEYTSGLDEEVFEDMGFTPEDLILGFQGFVTGLERAAKEREDDIRSITVVGGFDKSGRPEGITVDLKPGDIVSVVGPTGSGKSRLLADIEWMARGDTQTGRTILVNGRPVENGPRYASDRRLVAQLSQNMNFIVDLGIDEFITMHARARGAKDPEALVRQVVDTANTIAGEPLCMESRLAALSGGQSRALMIADTALVSRSPVILIDEIENAGIDRKRALDLLVEKKKIALVATHDPVLALMADRRIIVKNGGIAKVLETTVLERENLSILQRLDNAVLLIRSAIREGHAVEAPFAGFLEGVCGG